MNKHEFEKPNPFKNDMKKRFDENTEFAKEFIDSYNGAKNNRNIEDYTIDDEILGKRKKSKK